LLDLAKRGVIDHPKNKRLARLLGTIPGVSLGLLETIWHWVGEFRKDGALTLNDLEDALDSGGWLAMFNIEQVRDAMTNVERECIWLDVLADGRFYIHDWHEHAEDSIHNWLGRAKKLFANGARPSLKRLSQSERESIEAHYEQLSAEPCAQQAHKERTAIAIALPEPMPIPEPNIVVAQEADQTQAWEEFCRTYPRRSGALNKAKAQPKFAKLARDHPDILAGVRRYRQWCDATGKSGTEFVKQMDSWLNGRLWREEYEIPNGVVSMVNERDRILEQLHGT
jgi:hypothetical protein